ncbi:MAG: hypothetical protein WCQ32_01395 [bacterium]
MEEFPKPSLNLEKNLEEKVVKQGVAELFESNPELATIGTQEQYSTYLDTIFPDSNIKDIVYHGGRDGTIEKFRNNHFGIYLSYSPIRGVFGDCIYRVIVNAKNPLIRPKVDATIEEKVEYNKEVRDFYSTHLFSADETPVYKYDSAIESSSTTNEGVQIKIRNPEQIHILDSKDDTVKFKEFVSSKEDRIKNS